MITQYTFRVLGNGDKLRRWSELEIEDFNGDAAKLAEAARVVFDYLVKNARYFWPDVESVTMYGYEDNLRVGDYLAYHEYPAV